MEPQKVASGSRLVAATATTIDKTSQVERKKSISNDNNKNNNNNKQATRVIQEAKRIVVSSSTTNKSALRSSLVGCQQVGRSSRGQQVRISMMGALIALGAVLLGLHSTSSLLVGAQSLPSGGAQVDPQQSQQHRSSSASGGNNLIGQVINQPKIIFFQTLATSILIYC